MDADRADFERFATVEAPPSSPLHASLASIVARDDSLLALVRGRIVGEPGPNLLFGAVHRRLADRRDHPLADFFPSISGVRPVDGDLEKHFRAHAVPVVTHTHVLSKIPPEGRRRLDAVFVDASKGRRVHRVGNDFTKADGGIYAVEPRTYVDGDFRRAVVARCDGHATWIEWLGSV